MISVYNLVLRSAKSLVLLLSRRVTVVLSVVLILPMHDACMNIKCMVEGSRCSVHSYADLVMVSAWRFCEVL